MNGRVVFVLRAVDKGSAGSLMGSHEAGGGAGGQATKFDRRHTYLAYEGNIRTGSDAAERMPPTDLAKREAAIKEKRDKLKSPLFFVSPTRLSVRSLAKGVDDAALKALARQAALDGLAAGLATAAEGDPLLMAGSFAPSKGGRGQGSSTAGGGKRDAASSRVTVLSAKVMREPLAMDQKGAGPRARLEADGVTSRSKGYGFIEFGAHLHALAALRQLNNNPAYSTEFAAGGAAAVSGRRKAVQGGLPGVPCVR